jgi:hypothetical protein
MTTTEHEPTGDLTALQKLPEAEPASEQTDPTCATTGVPETPTDADPTPGTASATEEPAYATASANPHQESES